MLADFLDPSLNFPDLMLLELQGKVKTDVIIYIDGINHTVEIFEAPNEVADSHILADSSPICLLIMRETEKT